eukprot:CAMPEP_0180516438 /NCGR_PEP_ID=MMETSP1036_2-20121128/53918_1 /TAXON_ID=632150 /ORGANISM="Azadinium spinosum, Strain 3D9" /LENGTH=54 /DNA_ID=CAMNT_0022528237 /DNA_START=133 /DNA_END=294 /DNA_ORIENTATION=-
MEPTFCTTAPCGANSRLNASKKLTLQGLFKGSSVVSITQRSNNSLLLLSMASVA